MRYSAQQSEKLVLQRERVIEDIGNTALSTINIRCRNNEKRSILVMQNSNQFRISVVKCGCNKSHKCSQYALTYRELCTCFSLQVILHHIDSVQEYVEVVKGDELSPLHVHSSRGVVGCPSSQRIGRGCTVEVKVQGVNEIVIEAVITI